MVYQDGGTDFRVSVRSSLDCISMSVERGPVGDRCQILVSLSPDNLNVGAIRGEIIIHTNDPEFLELSVPIEGTILP
jgi:hypothetical protein